MKAFRSLELGAAAGCCSASQRSGRRADDGGGRGRRAAARAERPERSPHVGALPRARARLDGRGAPRADQDRPLVPHAVRADRRAVPGRRALVGLRGISRRHAADAQARRHSATASSAACSAPTKTPCARSASRHGLKPRLQAHRHLRGGVRVVHAVPVRHLREGVRGRPDAAPEGRHPRQRPEPHRPGHRVRLLLLPRRLRAARGGVRDGDDQLQPGDGLDRLRHRRSALLRAADLRGRLVDHRARAGSRRRRRVRRAVRRADAAQARAAAAGGRASGSSARRPTRSISPRIASASRKLLWDLGIPQAPSGTATTPEEAREVARQDRLPARRPAVVRPRRPRDGDRLRHGRARSLHADRRRRRRRDTRS